MKLIEVKQAKEFANTFLGDPILKMAVNSVLDNAPGLDLVRCKDCKFLHNEHGCTKFGHDYSYPVVLVNDFCSFGERRTDAETMGK